MRSPSRRYSRFRFLLSFAMHTLEAALNTALVVLGFLIFWGVP